MRPLYFVAFVAIGFLAVARPTHAESTLRVGSQVLTAGDSAARVTALLGRPSSRTHARGTSGRSGRRGRRGVRVIDGSQRGERWQYRRGDHVTTVTLVDGKVNDIDDHRL